MENNIFGNKYSKLNKKQKEAVDTVFGPVMVIAGPGTGKTTILTLRIANILRLTDAKPEEILAITFTDSGVKAVREKLREIIGDASFRVNIFTFHGFANYMRSIYPENFERIGSRIPCDELDQVEIIEEILSEKSFRELRVSTFGVNVRGIAKRISELKREAIDTKKLSKLIETEENAFEEEISTATKMTKTLENEIEKKKKYFVRLKEFNEVFALYEKKLEEKALYDFEDTILGLIDALSSNKSMQTEMRENFQFILADEHQDANGAQNEILKFFNDEESVDPPNLFVVGDDKQSIFRFQGANLENFYKFKDLFPTALKIDLEENYRSHKTILDVSHSLIVQDGHSHTKLNANVSYTQKPLEINEFNNEESEFQSIALEVKEKLEKYPNDTIAILSRNNKTLFRIATFLDALEVKFNLKGEQSLFESLEYKKIISLFEAINDPWNSPELVKSIFFGFFEYNLHDIFLLQDIAYKERRSFGDVFLSKQDLDIFEDKGLIVNLQETFKEIITESKKKPLLEFLKFLKDKIILNDKSEIYDILRLVFDEAEKLIIKKRNAQLSDFLAHLLLIEKHSIAPLSNISENDSRVTLASIHKSKGLEFDFVYVVSVTEKNFEKGSRKNDLLKIPGIGIDKDLAEERRLLYVALTRGKKHVAISYSLLGQKEDVGAPSILLDELDKNLIVKNKIEENINKIDLFSAKKNISNDVMIKLRERFLQRGFSVTALNNYLDCPYKYVFRNLLLIPDIKEFSALLGTACHEVLRRFHLKEKKGESMSDKDLKKIIQEEIIRQPFSSKDLEIALEKATENIEAYKNSFSGFQNKEKVFIEESLVFPYKVSSNKGDFELNINGKIDLAVFDEDKVSVIDFKSKKRMTRNAIMGLTKNDKGNEFRQLEFYKLLWQKSRQGEEVNKGSLVFLTPEKGKILSEEFPLEQENLEHIEGILRQVLIEIYEGQFIRKQCDDDSCEFCKSGFVL